MEEILQMSALELSKQIRHGSVSVKEAVEACKKQMQKSESQVHAYVSMDEKILAHRIKEVEEGIKSGRYTGPLAGVPIAVLSSEKPIWMNSPWEVRQRLPHSALPETPGIRNMYRVALPAVPARLWQREKR